MSKQQAKQQLQLHLGTNVVCTIDGDVMTLTIDLSHDAGPSKTGKSDIIASTNGNIAVGGTGVTLGLTAYRKRQNGAER